MEAGAAGMAVTGVVVLAAGLAAAGLPEAEVEVARDLGVAMAVMAVPVNGRGETEWARAVRRTAAGGTGRFLSRRATSDR